MENTKERVKRASFSLEPEYHDLFREIAKRTKRSMTDELRMMIDTRALDLGLTPLGEVLEEKRRDRE